MTPEKKSLDELLNLVRNNPPVRPLQSDEEVETILSRSSRDSVRRHSDEPTPNRRFLMGAFAVALLATAGALLTINQSDDVEQKGIAQRYERNGALHVQRGTAETLPSQRDGALRVQETPRPDTPTRVRITRKQTRTRTDTARYIESGHILVPDGESRTITIRRTTPADSSPASVVTPPRTNDGSASSPSIVSRKHTVSPSRLSILTTGNPKPLSRPELDISGTRYIELSPKELKRLGIHQNNGRLEVFGEELRQIKRGTLKDHDLAAALADRGYDTTQQEVVVRFQTTLDTMLLSIDAVENPTHNSYSAIAPIVIQSHHFFQDGRQRRTMIYFNRSPILTSSGGSLSDEDMLFLSGFDQKGNTPDITASPSINRLVAVRVLDDGTLARGTDGRTPEIILWYLPTREFIDLLPDRYRESLRKEVDAITAVQREKLPPGAVCERLTGEQTYLDICRTGIDAMQIGSISPNPAHDNITVRFQLRQPRSVTISLHDLSGHFISQLADLGSLGIGDHAPSFNLGPVVAGTYLVAIRTPQGEQVSQRLIVR